MLRSFLPLVFATLSLSTAAQNAAGELSPNPAPLGGTMSFALTDSTGQGLFFSNPCFWSVHAGAPNGPLVTAPFPGGACPSVIVPVPPHGSITLDWDLLDLNGNPVLPGPYWMRIRGTVETTLETFVEFFPFSIVDPTAVSPPPVQPVLRYTPPAAVGMSAPFQIDAPDYGGTPYFVAASLSANEPIVFQGQLLGLSLDPLLSVSLVSPSSVMTGAAGVLDFAGQAAGSLDVPPVPSLAFRGVQLQAFLDLGSFLPGFLATNALTITIQP